MCVFVPPSLGYPAWVCECISVRKIARANGTIETGTLVNGQARRHEHSART